MGVPTPCPRARALVLAPLLLLSLLVLRARPAEASRPPATARQADEAQTTFPPCPVKLPVRPDAQRIVGGRTPSSYLRSHLVSFKTAGCGGTLLSAHWVLTAAHCALTLDGDAYVGGSNFSNGFETSVDAIFKHPRFDFPRNDVALVRLKQPAPSGARFVRVNADAATPSVGEFARVAGFGFQLETFDVDLRGTLHQVDVPVISHARCKAAYTAVNSRLAPGIVPDLHVCAGYDTGGCDACLADSGGPLLVYDAADALVQVGVVSFGYGCGRKSMAGGYARVQPYLAWMRGVGATFETSSSHAPVFRPGYSAPPRPPTATEPTTAPPPGADRGPMPSTPPDPLATPDEPAPGESPWPSGGPGATDDAEPTASGEADGSDAAGSGAGGLGGSGGGAGGGGSGASVGGAGQVSAAAVGSGVGAAVVVMVAVVGLVVFKRRADSQRPASATTTPRASMT